MERQRENLSDELVQEGCRVSAGTFSLSPKVALQKLGSSQLPRASAWLLKVLQWAVSSGADRLDIRQSSRRTRILVSRCRVGVDSLLDALGRANLEVGPIGHLAVALRSLLIPWARSSFSHQAQHVWSPLVSVFSPFYSVFGGEIQSTGTFTSATSRGGASRHSSGGRKREPPRQPLRPRPPALSSLAIRNAPSPQICPNLSFQVGMLPLMGIFP